MGEFIYLSQIARIDTTELERYIMDKLGCSVKVHLLPQDRTGLTSIGIVNKVFVRIDTLTQEMDGIRPSQYLLKKFSLAATNGELYLDVRNQKVALAIQVNFDWIDQTHSFMTPFKKYITYDLATNQWGFPE